MKNNIFLPLILLSCLILTSCGLKKPLENPPSENPVAEECCGGCENSKH